MTLAEHYTFGDREHVALTLVPARNDEQREHDDTPRPTCVRPVDQIPVELKALPCWCLWKLVPDKRTGKPLKIPFRSTSSAAVRASSQVAFSPRTATGWSPHRWDLRH